MSQIKEADDKFLREQLEQLEQLDKDGVITDKDKILMIFIRAHLECIEEPQKVVMM